MSNDPRTEARHPYDNTSVDVGPFANAQSKFDDEPWIEPLTGWRRVVSFLLIIVCPWLVVVGFVTVIHELVAALPDVWDLLTW